MQNKVTRELDQDLGLAIERIDRLESYIYGDGDLCTIHEELNSLRKNVEFDDEQRTLLIERIETLEKRLKEVERFQDITHLEYRKVIQGRRPHKCPICDGCGMRPNPLKGCENAMMPVNLDCISCDGKGIVWG